MFFDFFPNSALKNHPKNSRGSGLIWVLGLAACWALLFHAEIFGGQTFVLMDDTRIFFPLWKWMGDVFQQGRIPLWNDQAGMGTPMWADPENAGAYLPLRVLYFFLDPVAAFTWSVLLHSLWGMLGFWFFSRARGFSAGSCFLGSLIFGFSTHPFFLTWDPTMLFAFSWIPWVFNAGLRLGLEDKKSYFPFSIAAAMQMSSGYPLYAYLTILALLAERTLEKKGETKEGVIGKNLMWVYPFGAGLGLALVFNLIWLIPFLEFYGFSNIPKRLEMPNPIPWGGLATWLNPFYLGHPLHSSGENSFTWLTCYFAGLPTVALILYGIWKGSLRKLTFGLFALWLLLSLGETAVVGGWLKVVFPFYHWVARSGYWISLLTFFAARLAAEAADSFFKEWKAPAGYSFLWLGFSAAVVFGALAAGVPWDLPSFWFVMVLMLLAGFSGKFISVGRPLLLSLAMAFSLGPVLESMHFTLPGTYYRQRPALWEGAAEGRIYHSPLLALSLERISGNGVGDAYEKAKECLAPNWPLGFGLEETFYFNTIFFQTSLDWCYSYFRYSPAISRKLLDYLNTRYLVGTHHFEGLRPKGMTGQGIPVSENPNPLPKWFSVRSARLEGEWPADVWRFGEPSFDFRKDCLILNASRVGDYFVRQDVRMEGSGGRRELVAPGKGKALLVSSELGYPGWRAWVEGKPCSIESVNHSFRGLVLEEGETKARLEFAPVSFRFGCFLSLLVCALWSGMFFKLAWKD